MNAVDGNATPERDPGASPLRLSLSVVVPCWNDGPALAATVQRLLGLRGCAQAAGGAGLEIVAAVAGGPPGMDVPGADVTVRCPEPSRGRQMNLGARAASGDVLLFQHVDTEFTAAHLEALLAALRADPTLAGGAFHRRFDSRHPGLRWLEPVAREWARRGAGLFYGDQSIFLRRETFEQLGGFADIPLMEDLDFARRLRRVCGRARVRLLDPPIATSARRHLERGAWRTSLQNGLFIVLYRLGVSPHRLHRWYYNRPGREARNPKLEARNKLEAPNPKLPAATPTPLSSFEL